MKKINKKDMMVLERLIENGQLHVACFDEKHRWLGFDVESVSENGGFQLNCTKIDSYSIPNPNFKFE